MIQRQSPKKTSFTALPVGAFWRGMIERSNHSVRGMFFFILILFTLVPLVELGLLIWIGIHTSLGFTIGLVLMTGILGASLARWQGWRTVERIHAEWAGHRIPADALLDAFLILIAGLFLVTPGILTDLLGFALLIPPVRTLAKRRLIAWFHHHVQVQIRHFSTPFDHFWASGQNEPMDRSQIIDAKVIETRVEEDASDEGQTS